jgi:hypothetical protein
LASEDSRISITIENFRKVEISLRHTSAQMPVSQWLYELANSIGKPNQKTPTR